ncbi:MAG TPA: hypothetical protein VGK70_08695 [Thermoanaerobaculia bacterium]|jgi:hypothetical protein
MRVSAGSHLGPYEILAPLGAGRMGAFIGRGTRGCRARSRFDLYLVEGPK